MSNQVFKIKTDDTYPPLQVSVSTKGNLTQPTAFNMSGVTGVTFTMVDDCNNNKVYAQSGSILCSSGGTIQYQWQDGDTDTDGTYFGEFKLYLSGGSGTRMSIPYMGGIKIEITGSINKF